MVRLRLTIASLIVCYTAVCSLLAQGTAGASWRVVGNLSIGRANPACVAIDGQQVLVLGGYVSGFSPSSAVDLLTVNGTQVSVERLPDMLAPHAESPAFLLGDTAVVVFGGLSSNGMAGTIVEYFSLSQRKWIKLGDLRIGRRQHAVTKISEREFLIVGGRHTDLTTMADAEIFDVRTGASTFVSSYPIAINGGHGNVTSTGVPYIAGGRSGGPNSDRSARIYTYDRAAGKWSSIGQLGPSGLEAPLYTRLRNGQAMVVGGSEAEEPLRFTCRVLLETAGSFKECGCMPERVIYAGVAQWSDDRVVVAGGINDYAGTTQNSIFINVQDRQVIAGPLLNFARRYTRAVSVRSDAGGPSGWSVLCIGGFGPSGNTLSSIEMLVEGCDGGTLTDVQTSQYSVAVGTAVIGDRVAMLTDTTQYSSGAIWAKNKVAVADGFTTAFRFRLADGNDRGQIDGSQPGADGVALVIQNTSDRPLGKPGEGIGYEDIANSVAIEFDSYLNAHYNDPNGSHVAVQSNGKGLNKPWHQPPYQRALQVLPVSLRDNVSYYVKVAYSPGALQVYFAAGPVNATTPPDFGPPVVSLSSFDLTSMLDLESDGSAWLGITSATGRSTERHYIDAWSIDGCQLATTSVTWDDERSSHGVVVQPNPANEFVTITTPSAMQARRIVIADLSGRIVASVDAPSHEHAIDVSTLPSGMYVVRIEGAERQFAVPLSIVR